jgi:transcriptional accessory protein Tex/SPT6
MLKFISLKLDTISYECLNWVLKSLRCNEMTPSERAIQSRIKEAFALKIQPNIWQEIINQILSKDQAETLPIFKISKE